MKRINLPQSILGILLILIVISSSGWSNSATAQENSDQTIFIPMVARKSSQSETTAIVRLLKDAYNQIADLIQPLHIIDYKSFVWLEISNQDLSILENSAIDFELQQEATLLLLNRFRFDPLKGEPEILSEQRTSYDPGEEGFHLVQFAGPTKDEWLERMEVAGVTTIQFQPSFAYIVRMTPEEATLVDEEDFSRWVGVYHPAYRIAPSLLEPLVPESEEVQEEIIRNVAITIFDDGEEGGSVDITIKEIQALGGQLIDQEKARAEDLLVTAIFVLPSPAVTSVAQLNNVLWLNFQPPVDEPDDEMSDQIIAGNFNPLGAGYQAWLTTKGVNGAGVTVALIDTGYDTGVNATAHPDLQGRLIPVGTPVDTNGHGTHVGGIIAGNATLGTTDASGFFMGLGVAPNVNLVVRTSNGLDPARTRDAVINGATASNHSYSIQGGSSGYTARDSTYDSLVRDADQTTVGVVEPLTIVFSAGNCGNPASLPGNCQGNTGPTKEAKNVIAVGSTRNLRDVFGNPGTGNIATISGSSSRGPAGDGRLYPHIVAPGGNIISTLFTGAPTRCDGIAAGAPPANPTYSMCSGTSMAAPHVTGAVALITEWWRIINAGANPSPAMAKALIVNGATDIGAANIPNNNEGWGRMNLDNVIVPPVPVIYRDQVTTFGATGQTWSLSVGPDDPTQPLKVTLVWSDAPGAGSGGTTAAWANDLDLTVTQGATTFLGNVFINGFSTTGGAADFRNNTENVYIQNPSGVYNITVAATNIAGDGVPFNGDTTDQDFALVCYNCKPTADLSITKNDSPDPVTAGENLTYTLTVTNNGPSDASGVSITDTLPAEVTLVSATPSQGSCSGSVTCDLGNLANGASATVTIVVTVDLATPCGTITNAASVGVNETDPDPSNNATSEDTIVQVELDLMIDFEGPSAGSIVDSVSVGNGISVVAGSCPVSGIVSVLGINTWFIQNAAMIYDSTNPTGGDDNLAGFMENKNLLIISEDLDSTDPDDNRRGGIFELDFANFGPGEVSIQSIEVFDIDPNEPGGTIVVEMTDDSEVTTAIPITGNHAKDIVSIIDGEFAKRMIVTLIGSGAIDNIRFLVIVQP